MSGVRINTLNILDLVHHERRGHRRINSTGRTLNGGVRILSRYRRPSLSSCHDFCKFGVEQTLEIKARGLLAMPLRNTATPAEGDEERTSISADRKKKLALRVRSFPASKTQKLDFPILNGAVSPLTMEQTVLSGQVSPPVKEIEFSVIRVDDPKMKSADDPKMKSAEDRKVKPLRPNQSSGRMERRSNDKGQVNIETNKEMGSLSTDSPRGSSSRRGSKAKRNNEMGNFVTGERKALVTPSLVSSPKHSPKKVSNRNSQKSNNEPGVSHFNNKRTVRKPQPEQPSWEDVPEKTLHVVEPNAEGITPSPIKSGNCVTELSLSSFSSSEDKSLEQAKKGSLTAQPSTLSSKLNLRRTLSGTPATNSPSSQPPSAKQNLRRTQSGVQAADSPPTCPSSAKQNLRRTQSGIQAGDSPPSCLSTAKQNLRLTQNGTQAANSPPSAKQNLRHTQSGSQSGISPSSGLPTAKQNLRHTQWGIQAINSPPFCPPSPRKKGSRGTQLGTHTSSLASLTAYSSAPPRPAETSSENQTSNLKKQYKNGPREGGSISSKDDNVPGKKLPFRRGRVVDLHPAESAPTRLKFRCGVLGKSQNGKGDASKETPGKKEANTAQLPPFPAKKNTTHTENRTNPNQSRLSWPPSPKNEGLRGTQPGIHIARSNSSSLASMSAHSETSSEIGETDVKNQKSDLEKEDKNSSRKDRPSTLKDEQYLGQKLTFRRGKVVELHPVDSTPMRLKFKKRVFGDSQNGEGDAGSKTVEKKEAIAARLSWPPSTKEKGLRGIEFELGSTITRSYSCTSSLFMNGDGTDTEKQLLDMENEVKNMHEMDGTTSSKEESDLVQKLTFRRGKVVDIIHSEDTALRRLKFKRRESLFGDSNQNDSGDAGRIILGKQEINDGTKTESKDVVLKHQDVEGKNSGSLLNNVIEETVSKLVQTRKSKVKALVGAFETVISLQDTKHT